MKKILAISFILLLFIPVFIYAQEKEGVNEELTEKQAQAELVEIKGQLAAAEAQISALESEISALKSEVARCDELKAKLADLNETWKRCQYGRYAVVEGDWLSTIAGMRNVYNNGAKWPMIYEANKDKVKNPNLIYPGWVLLIPFLDHYTVIPGDYLSLIASYLSIYSNSKRWPEIYEANKANIKDPDLIYPKQEFVVPHE